MVYLVRQLKKLKTKKHMPKFYGRGGTKELRKSQLPAFLGALGFIIVD